MSDQPSTAAPVPQADAAPRSAVGELLGRARTAEPPPGARERSWRRLSHRLGARPATPAWVPVTALVAVVLLAVVYGRARPAEPAAGGELATTAQEVETPPGGSATLRLGGVVLTFHGSSSASFVKTVGETGRPHLRLERGGVTARPNAAATAGTAAVVVSAADAYVEGSSFELRLASDGQLTVVAYADSVRIVRADGEQLLRPGEQWPPAADPVLESAVDPNQQAPARGPAPAERLARVLPKSPVQAPAAPVMRTHVKVAPPMEAAPARFEDVEAATLDLLSAPPAPPPVAETEAEKWAAAQRLVRSGRFAEALAVLDPLGTGSGLYAGMALYEAGRVRSRDLGDHAAALRAFAAYRERFPTGSLRPEVELAALEATIATADWPEALRVAEAFLAGHPTSERRAEVRLLRANILRDLGRLREARAEYEALARAPGRLAADALFLSAFCARELGDEAGARQNLELYLAQHPAGAHRQQALRALGRAGAP